MYAHALVQALRAQVALGDQITDADLARPSHCEGWTVKEVLNHSIGVTLKFTAFARGETDAPRTPPGDLIGDDHREALRAAALGAEQAWTHADLSRTCRMSFGTFSASTAAGLNLFDVLAHGWDVAGPTGNRFVMPDSVWNAGLRAAREVIGDDRDSNHYGLPLPSDGASPRTAFLAYLGRADADA